MAENRRGKDGRFYFSRAQLVLLGAAFLVASVVIFTLGMFVGKGIEGRRLFQKEEPLVKIPIKPGGVESGATPAKNEISFNEASTRAAAPNPAEETGGRSAGPEKSSRPEPRQSAAKETEKKSEKVARNEDSAKQGDAPKASDATGAGRTWRAQVNAFPDERSARLIVDRLKNKGYNAYVTEVQNRGKSWYRVNVGKYDSREEADKMADLLRTKENFPKAFAASR